MASKSIAAMPDAQAVGWETRSQLTSPSNGELKVANAAGTSYFSLVAEAANTIAVRNGTNAQSLCLYKTYTDASNYERQHHPQRPARHAERPRVTRSPLTAAWSMTPLLVGRGG